MTSKTDSTQLPFISVVMPVYNEQKFIEKTLLQILSQDYPSEKFEVLVVDGMSTDNTRKIVLELTKLYRHLKLLNNPKRKSGAGRNIGFKSGRGEYFVVIDGHCYIPTTNLLKNTAAAFEKSGADCLGRPQPLNPPGLSQFQKAVAVARASSIGHGKGSFIYSDFEGFISPTSNGAAYSRKVFDTVGYVDENFDAAEDFEFNYRVEKAGLKCFASPSLEVRYYPRENLKSLFFQLLRYGKGRCRFIRKHREAFSQGQLIPLFFVCGLLLASISSLLFYVSKHPPLLLLLPLAPYIFYLLILIIISLKIALEKNFRFVHLLLLIFPVIHFSLGWGFLIEALAMRNSSS